MRSCGAAPFATTFPLVLCRGCSWGVDLRAVSVVVVGSTRSPLVDVFHAPTLALTHVVSVTRRVHKRSFERASSLDVGNKKNAEAGTVSVADHRGGACDDAQLVAALDRVGFEAKVVSKVAGEPPALAAGDDEERGAALDGSSAAEERVGLRTTDAPPPSSPPRGGEDAAAAGSWWK